MTESGFYHTEEKINHEINTMDCYADADAIKRTAEFIFLLT
jgi:hypothetical protein